MVGSANREILSDRGVVMASIDWGLQVGHVSGDGRHGDIVHGLHGMHTHVSPRLRVGKVVVDVWAARRTHPLGHSVRHMLLSSGQWWQGGSLGATSIGVVDVGIHLRALPGRCTRHRRGRVSVRLLVPVG